jgi:hypothetical protein
VQLEWGSPGMRQGAVSGKLCRVQWAVAASVRVVEPNLKIIRHSRQPLAQDCIRDLFRVWRDGVRLSKVVFIRHPHRT